MEVQHDKRKGLPPGRGGAVTRTNSRALKEKKTQSTHALGYAVQGPHMHPRDPIGTRRVSGWNAVVPERGCTSSKGFVGMEERQVCTGQRGCWRSVSS